MQHERIGNTLKGKKILIVEDEYFIADDLKKAVAETGAIVSGPVPTLEEALAVLDADTIDLAVLDINLHGDFAYPIADRLRSKGIPFVFATGYTEASIPPAYRSVPRWEKPFSLEKQTRALGGLG